MKIGDIKYLKKPSKEGFRYKKYEIVTVVNLLTGKKIKKKKWVGYF